MVSGVTAAGVGVFRIKEYTNDNLRDFEAVPAPA